MIQSVDEKTQDLFPDLWYSTAIYPNRVADKAIIESSYDLPERGCARSFMTVGGTLFAERYVRVVYGDHGPYVEFDPKDVLCKLTRKWRHPAPEGVYFEWLHPAGEPGVKVYDQRRTVRNLPNPPYPGFQGNRAEGYADYRVGMVYVSPHDFGSIA